MTIGRKYISYLMLLLLLISVRCKSTYNASPERSGYKSIYVDQFKLTYFRKLLIKGFNNSGAVREVINFDRSGFTEPILTMDDLMLIDSLTTIDNFKMQMDSTNSIGRVAEGAEGKHPFAYILNKFQSKWLDSLARKRYKLSGKNITWAQ